MVGIAVACRPHGMHQGSERLIVAIEPAVEQAIDAVGARGQTKAAVAERNGDLAANFGAALGETDTPHRVPADEPRGDPQEPRPPECARFRKILEGAKRSVPSRRSSAN